MKSESRQLSDNPDLRWESNTSPNSGDDRGLSFYSKKLGIEPRELEGKKILDLGSGKTDKFARDLSKNGINCDVVSLNPDLIDEEKRKEVRAFQHEGKLVAGIGEELPFQNNSFDGIYALFSASSYSKPSLKPENFSLWTQEALRVLKPGGEIRIAPVSQEELQVYEDRFTGLADVTVVEEKVPNYDFGFFRVIIKKRKDLE